MIERLRHLYILDGSPSVYADLAREWERRGERWCGGVKHEPPMTLEELKGWAEVEFPLLRVFNSSGYRVDGVELWDDRAWVASVRIGDDSRPSLVWWGGHNHQGTPTYIRTHCILYDQQLQNECRGGRACPYTLHGITWKDFGKVSGHITPSGSCTESC